MYGALLLTQLRNWRNTMAKREIPLFVIDTNRYHNIGEADFLVCTDRENGFIAKMEYVTGENDIVTDTLRIGGNNGGIKLRMEVKRIIGTNPSANAIRTLMKKGFEFFTENVQVKVDIDQPTTEQCISFLEEMIRTNRHYIQQAGVDYEERKTIMTSLKMLESIENKLKNE